MPARPVTVSNRSPKFTSTLTVGPHTLTADELPADGGEDLGPAPFELLASALAACTAITLRVYAGRKSWPLETVDVTVEQAKGTDLHTFTRTLKLGGPLDAEQKQRLLEIAGKCPVHKALVGEIQIVTALG